MAAIAYPINDPWVAPRSEAVGRDRGIVRADRPIRAALPEPRVYRRRRAVALLVLVVAVLVAATALRSALAGPGGGALTTSGSSGAFTAPASRIYVVQPGDSLWSIVRATGRGGDPRPQVDRLALQLAGRPLQPGDRLRLP